MSMTTALIADHMHSRVRHIINEQSERCSAKAWDFMDDFFEVVQDVSWDIRGSIRREVGDVIEREKCDHLIKMNIVRTSLIRKKERENGSGLSQNANAFMPGLPIYWRNEESSRG